MTRHGSTKSSHEIDLVERLASFVRSGRLRAVREFIDAHPSYLAFLDLPAPSDAGNARTWANYAERHGQRELASLFLFDLPPDPVWVALGAAERAGDVGELRRLLDEHPAYLTAGRADMLADAARESRIEMFEMLLRTGGDINAIHDSSTLLERAARNATREMVEYLLANGADPNIGRPMISAINRAPEEEALEIVQLLVEHGADVNREYRLYDTDTTFTALEWAASKPTIEQYLRSKGAVERPKESPEKTVPENLADEIVGYFEEQFGPLRPQAQIEIVPADPAIAIHVIPATHDHNYVTLFTTGMSERAMTLPADIDDFAYAELFIQLPASWPIDKKSLSDPRHAWPIHWLRSIARYPHDEHTWLGGPATVIANGEPPEPLGPALRFTCLFLMAEREFRSRDGRKIHLYRLIPLYTEERNLEIKHGLVALVRALDEHEVSFVVDPNRLNVGLSR